MKLILFWNRARIAADACLRHFRKPGKKSSAAQKTVLIVFQQVFGDAVLIQSSLAEYLRIFPGNEGYTVKFLARPSVIAFLRDVTGFPEGLQTEAVDFKRFLEDYAYYREIVSRYQGTAGILIVPGSSLSGEIFACASDASRKIGLTRSMPVRHPPVMALFDAIAYTERIKPEATEMVLLRHRRLLRYLGSQDYRAEPARLLPQKRVIEDEHYCVLCPGASVPEKRWPVERYAEIADTVTEKYHINIHLCGGAEERECGNQIRALVRHPEKVISHIGKSSFAEWSSIVQYADLVVGNDSATIHLAAAAGRPAVCVAGVYDKDLFFPYQTDLPPEETLLPVHVKHDMPCAWCRTVGYEAGYGNPSCRTALRAGQCVLCVSAVKEESVKQAIHNLMSGNNRGGVKISIELLHGLGDLVCAVPMLAAVRNRFPDAYITVLVKFSPGRDIVLASGVPVDEIIVLNLHSRKFLTNMRKLWYLRKKHYSIGIESPCTPVWKAKLFMDCITPEIRVGLQHSHGIGPGGLDDACHFVDANLLAARPLLDMKPVDDIPRLYPDVTLVNRLKNRLSLSDKYVVGICVGNGDISFRNRLFRCGRVFTRGWGIQNIHALTRRLLDSGCQVILIGGSLEIPLLRSFPADVLKHMNLRNMVNKTTLAESIALTALCNVVVGVDTGMMHIAAATGKPTVSLFGPTNPRTHGPRSRKAVFVESPVSCKYCYGTEAYVNCQDRQCLKTITVEQAFSAVALALRDTDKKEGTT